MRATTTVPHSTLHVSWNKDPGNVPFYRQENDLNPGESFSLLTQNDDGSQGTLAYRTPAGVHVTVTFLWRRRARSAPRRRARSPAPRWGLARGSDIATGGESDAPTRYFTRVSAGLRCPARR